MKMKSLPLFIVLFIIYSCTSFKLSEPVVTAEESEEENPTIQSLPAGELESEDPLPVLPEPKISITSSQNSNQNSRQYEISEEKNVVEEPSGIDTVNAHPPAIISSTEAVTVTKPETVRDEQQFSDNRAITEEKIFTIPADDIIIRLPGSGWIFLGSTGEAGRVRFRNQSSTGGNTHFKFRAEETGIYTLNFQQQDMIHGTSREARVVLEVVPEAEYEEKVFSKDQLEQDKITGDYTLANALFERGELEDAWVEYNRQYREGNADIDRRIAILGMKIGKEKEVLPFFMKILPKDPGDEEAFSSALTASLHLKDLDYLEELSEYLSALEKPVEEILLAGDLLRSGNKNISAIQFYKSYARLFPFSFELDRVYFELGKMYQEDEVLKDERIAVEYFKLLREDFPASRYWDEAVKRIQYLERHFLHIR